MKKRLEQAGYMTGGRYRAKHLRIFDAGRKDASATHAGSVDGIAYDVTLSK